MMQQIRQEMQQYIQLCHDNAILSVGKVHHAERGEVLS